MMMIHRGLRPPLILPILLTVAPSVATAHLTSTGFGSFYDGLTHVFTTPEDLLPVVALSLLAGLRGKRFGRTVLFTLPGACVAGCIASYFLSAPVSIPLVPALLALLLGLLVAVDRPIPLPLQAGLAAVTGILVAGFSGIDLKGISSGLAVIGIAAAPFVIAALIAGNVAAVQALWARVAVRVAGSWIAAMGLLMLGWAVHRA